MIQCQCRWFARWLSFLLLLLSLSLSPPPPPPPPPPPSPTPRSVLLTESSGKSVLNDALFPIQRKRATFVSHRMLLLVLLRAP